MSLWVRLFVLVPFLVCVAFALLLMLNGDSKASLGPCLIAGLISPLLIEVFWPGRYALRKPDGEVEDNLFNRLKQFRVDYPGRDGTIFLGVFALIGIGILAGGVVRISVLFTQDKKAEGLANIYTLALPRQGTFQCCVRPSLVAPVSLQADVVPSPSCHR